MPGNRQPQWLPYFTEPYFERIHRILDDMMYRFSRPVFQRFVLMLQACQYWKGRFFKLLFCLFFIVSIKIVLKEAYLFGQLYQRIATLLKNFQNLDQIRPVIGVVIRFMDITL